MNIIGTVESLWRYPVKSMKGEQLEQALLGFAGVYGDRFYAFTSSAAQKGFPFFTARERHDMLLYRPTYRSRELMRQPPNLAEAESLPPGASPVYPESFEVDVETPSGAVFAIDDPALKLRLEKDLDRQHELTLIRSHRALTDCRPVSLFSLQTVSALSRELETDLDKRRFRANIYVSFPEAGGFYENDLVGRQLRIGAKAVISIVDRDPRCKMITLDPETGEPNPGIMRRLARDHEGKAGVYAAVLAEGLVRPGDEIALLS